MIGKGVEQTGFGIVKDIILTFNLTDWRNAWHYSRHSLFR